MKFLKVFVFGLLFLWPFTQNMYAESTVPDPNANLRSTIERLVNLTNFGYIDRPERATVTFTINKSGEIVVIDVLSNNSDLCNFIKSRLNYEDSNFENYHLGTIFYIDLQFV